MKKYFYLFLILLLTLSCYTACSRCSKQESLQIPVHRFKLPNGMTCLFVKREGAPVFSAYLRIKTGSLEEPPGSSGLAHFFEHLAFKGTPTIGTKDFEAEKKILEDLHATGAEIVDKRQAGASEEDLKPLKEKLKSIELRHHDLIEQNEFYRIYQRNGGNNLNASTSSDDTVYFVSLPSNKLELWAYVESERLAHPVFREFYKERDVVAEERRMRTDNDPDGRLFEKFMALTFPDNHYGIPVVGFADEIQNYTYKAAKEFRDRYYIPSRMTLALVGNFNENEAERLVRQYFGKLESREDQLITAGEEKLPDGFPKEITLGGPDEPRFYMGFRRPTHPHPDDELFDVLQGILCDGRSSRLFTSLIKEKKLATSIRCYAAMPGARLHNLFFIHAIPLAPHSNREVQQEIINQLETIKKSGITKEELQKARNKFDAQLLFGMEDNMGLATWLTYFESMIGDWKYLYRLREKIARMTPEDIGRVVNTYFVPERQVSAFLEKDKK